MTRKDYELIAKAISVAVPGSRSEIDHEYYRGVTRAKREIASAIAVELLRDNPRFDRARFFTACGIVQ